MSSSTSGTGGSARDWVKRELHFLTTITPSDRSWQLPLGAALAAGLPLMIGAAIGRLDYGLVASLGGMVFLYLPPTPLYHRMVQVMACACAMCGCYALGLLSHLVPWTKVPMLIFVATSATMLTRLYAVGPPGSLFFIMVASIGATTPVTAEQVPTLAGWFSLGTIQATVVSFFYSLWAMHDHAPKPVPPRPETTFDYVALDPVLIGLAVGCSLAIALALHLEKTYWVPVACIAVLQGTTLRAVWNRQVHRVLGTAVGLLVAWGLLQLPLTPWLVAALVMLLVFVIELTIVRHYLTAAVFFTPLGILLAEAATLGQSSAAALISARFLDTLLGAFVGFVGGVCLHSPRCRAAAGKPLRWLIDVWRD